MTPHTTLVVGPLSLDLDPPAIRNVALLGKNFLQSLTVTFRDAEWRTVPIRVDDTVVAVSQESTNVTMRGRATGDEFEMVWETIFSAFSDRRAEYSFIASATRPLERARVGICVMKPIELAGQPLIVDTLEGRRAMTFPAQISTDRSITELTGLAYSIPDAGELHITFDGDLFEFEDQRNWADASFKTFSTPLSSPVPVSLEEGEVVQQSLGMSWTPSRPLRNGRRGRSGATQEISVELGGPLRQLLAVGVDIDLVPPGPLQWTPDHIRGTVDLSAAGWLADAKRLLATAERLGTRCQVDVLAPAANSLRSTFYLFGENRDLVESVFVFDALTWLTDGELSTVFDELRQATGLPVGGGTYAEFARLSFQREKQPNGEMDSLTFSLCPLMHYDDEFTLLTNIESYHDIVTAARLIGGSCPIHIGHISLTPRTRPAGQGRRIPGSTVAAWTVATLARLISMEVSSLTFSGSNSSEQLVDAMGEMSTRSLILDRVLRQRGESVMETSLMPAADGIEAFALASRERSTLFVANLASRTMAIKPAEPWPTEIEIIGGDVISHTRDWDRKPIVLAPHSVGILSSAG